MRVSNFIQARNQVLKSKQTEPGKIFKSIDVNSLKDKQIFSLKPNLSQQAPIKTTINEEEVEEVRVTTV